jgi:hypothetical protein
VWYVCTAHACVCVRVSRMPSCGLLCVPGVVWCPFGATASVSVCGQGCAICDVTSKTTMHFVDFLFGGVSCHFLRSPSDLGPCADLPLVPATARRRNGVCAQPTRFRALTATLTMCAGARARGVLLPPSQSSSGRCLFFSAHVALLLHPSLAEHVSLSCLFVARLHAEAAPHQTTYLRMAGGWRLCAVCLCPRLDGFEAPRAAALVTNCLPLLTMIAWLLELEHLLRRRVRHWVCAPR